MILVCILGIYLFVTMTLTSFSIILTICILQIHHVGPRQRRMPSWVKSFAFDYLARFLCIRSIVHNFLKDVHIEDAFAHFPRPAKNLSTPDLVCSYVMELAARTAPPRNGTVNGNTRSSKTELEAMIADQMKKTSKLRMQREEQTAIGDEWRLLAIILDRLFFWIYTVLSAISTIAILLVMPTTGEWFSTHPDDSAL